VVEGPELPKLEEVETMTRTALADVLARLAERLPTSEQETQTSLPSTWPACAQVLHRLEQRVEHGRAATNAAPRRAVSSTAAIAITDGDASSDAWPPSDDAASDNHDDVCTICHNSGELLMCDQCPRVYHLHCVNPPLRHVPRYAWVCAFCVRALRWPAHGLGIYTS